MLSYDSVLCGPVVDLMILFHDLQLCGSSEDHRLEWFFVFEFSSDSLHGVCVSDWDILFLMTHCLLGFICCCSS